MATISQSASDVWHNNRQLRITGSSAYKVPVRDKTNSDNFIREYLYPSVKGDKLSNSCKHGKECEIFTKQQLRSSGSHIPEL